MKRLSLPLMLGVLSSTASLAADRAIALAPVHAMSWEFLTPQGTSRGRPGLGVGFWQRASGAKPGVGANFVAVMEFQLPETAPTRVRSATLQSSGHQSQCIGAEPVVIDVYAYPADGKGEVTDATSGTRVAQMSAECRDNPAFARPIDVTHIVRQMSVAAGIRHVGFNVRKANNRQGPGMFNLVPGTLTVVVADQEVAHWSLPTAPAATTNPGVARATPSGTRPQAAADPHGLRKAFVAPLRGTGGNTNNARQ